MYTLCRASQVVLVVKNTPANAGDIRDAGSIPGSGRSLEDSRTTHSITVAWRIPWTEEPGGLWSTGLQRVGHDWGDLACTHTCILYVRRGDLAEAHQLLKGNVISFASWRMSMPQAEREVWACLVKRVGGEGRILGKMSSIYNSPEKLKFMTHWICLDLN